MPTKTQEHQLNKDYSVLIKNNHTHKMMSERARDLNRTGKWKANPYQNENEIHERVLRVYLITLDNRFIDEKR